MGSSVRGVFRSRGVSEFSFFVAFRHCLTFFLLSVFYDTFVVVFVVFVIYFDGEGELAYEIRCCEKIPAVQPVGREMLERNAVNLPMLRHTTILVGDHTRRPILQIGPESS